MTDPKERSLEIFKQAIEEKKREIRSSLGHLALQKENRTKPPKRISKQMFKQFFENHIIVCKNNFYCCCCCKFLDNHCAAFEHTSEIEHCKFVDRAAASRRSWIILSERTNFELLVSEAIVNFDANNFKCRICNDEMFAISKLTEHLQNFWHRYYSLRFDQTSIEQLDSAFSIFGDLEDSCIIIDIVETVCPDCASSASDLSMTRLLNQVEENRRTSKALMRSSCQDVENIVKELKEMATGRKTRRTRSPLPEIQKISEAPLRETSKCQNDLLGSEKLATIPKKQKTVTSQETRSSSSIHSTGTETFTSQIETPRNCQNICSGNKKTATSLQETKSNSPIDSTRTETFTSQIEPPPNCQKICSGIEKTATSLQETKSKSLIDSTGTETFTSQIEPPPNCQNICSGNEKTDTSLQETKSNSPIDSTGTETFTSQIEPPPNCQKICSGIEKTATSLQETQSNSPVVQKNTGPPSSGLQMPSATRFRRARYGRRRWMGSCEGITSKSPEETSRIYLFCKQNLDEWLCKMCNKTVTVIEGIAKHETEIEHKDLYKKYGCENIRMIEPSIFTCVCCNCTIPGIINVLAHLRGLRHSTCLAAKLRDKKSETESIPSTNLSEIIPSDKKQELVVYVQHFQNLSIKKMLNRRLKAQAKSAAMTNFECQYCHLHIVRGDDFHTHLASHISLEFANSKIDENANDPHNFGLENQSTSLLNHAKPISLNSRFRNEPCIEKKTESNDFQVIFTF